MERRSRFESSLVHHAAEYVWRRWVIVDHFMLGSIPIGGALSFGVVCFVSSSLLFSWARRLTGKMLPSHGSDTGSIPVESTARD